MFIFEKKYLKTQSVLEVICQTKNVKNAITFVYLLVISNFTEPCS
jgi:hypothetical protein